MARYVLLSAGVLLGLFAGPASAQDARLAQLGRELYQNRECDRCHMVAGHGHQDGKLDGVASRISADDMRRWLSEPRVMEAKLDKKPKVRMSSRKQAKFTETELAAILAYLRTLR
jgi:hypothetical protein